MQELLALSSEDISQVLTLSDALDAVEGAYRQKALGTGEAWPMVYHEFQPGAADMDIRSGELSASGLFGLKITTWFSDNPGRGLPEVIGTTLLCDDRDGLPLAILNAGAVTGLRTGAAGALGAKWLAREEASVLVVVGTGAQAPFQIAATILACPNIREIVLCNPRSADRAHAREADVSAKVTSLLAAASCERRWTLSVGEDLAATCSKADVIITATPSTEPVLMRDWVRPGTHISCVGADMEGKRELDPALMVRARVYVDDRTQSMSAGECEMPVKEGAISAEDIIAELGEVIAGTAEGRTSDEQITVFDTSGIAIQDLAASKIAYDRAVERGIGTRVAL